MQQDVKIDLEKEKFKVVIAQLGSPRSPLISDVRQYLAEFLRDPRVVDLPRFFWLIILYLFILPFRPKKSAALYARIWQDNQFPLVRYTESFTRKVQQYLTKKNIEVDFAFLLGPKRVEEVFEDWEKEHAPTRAQRLIILPQFPQYSEATTASVIDKMGSIFKHAVNIPRSEYITSYYNLKCFIDLSVQKINSILEANPTIDALVLSFHGIPLRRVTQKRDIYYQHCFETYNLIKERVSFNEKDIHLVFQSRFGREVWLTPATDEYCIELVEQGRKHLAVYCPSFVVDCLETIDEIGHELSQEISAIGAKLTLVPCLNDDDQWARGYAHYIEVLTMGSYQELFQLHYPRSAINFEPN